MSAELLIYEVIGDDWMGGGMTAKRFHDELKSHGDAKEITVRINSPGGNVADGDAIYNALVRHPARVVVEIDGVAASAASYIAMAGDEIRIAENGIMMIHRAMSVTIGNTLDHAKAVDWLDKVDGTIAGIYSKRTGRRAETWLKMMSDETYFTAEEAVENKLATSITSNKRGTTALWTPEHVAVFDRDHRPSREEIDSARRKLGANLVFTNAPTRETILQFARVEQDRKPSADALAARLKEVA